MKIFTYLILFSLIAFSACAPAPVATLAPTQPELAAPTSIPTAKAGALPPKCALQPVIVPTIPAEVPSATELDETTGLHLTGKAVEINLEDYRLTVSGKVDYPLRLTYDELRCMPRVTMQPVLVCVGVFEDVTQWSGVPLKYVLELAGIQEDARSIYLLGADGYQAGISVDEAIENQVFLAYQWKNEPLPILHGFPLRVASPISLGSYWVKWLVGIKVE